MSMSIVEFINLVAAMRSAQRVYFRDRTQAYLLAAKNLEREVDDAIDNFTTTNQDTQPRPPQPQLPLTYYPPD